MSNRTSLTFHFLVIPPQHFTLFDKTCTGQLKCSPMYGFHQLLLEVLSYYFILECRKKGGKALIIKMLACIFKI